MHIMLIYQCQWQAVPGTSKAVHSLDLADRLQRPRSERFTVHAGLFSKLPCLCSVPIGPAALTIIDLQHRIAQPRASLSQMASPLSYQQQHLQDGHRKDHAPHNTETGLEKKSELSRHCSHCVENPWYTQKDCKARFLASSSVSKLVSQGLPCPQPSAPSVF